MGIDVMIVADAEAIASPSDEMFDWLETRFEDFEIRYGSIALSEDAVRDLIAKFGDDPAGAMLIDKVAKMKAVGERAPYLLELMIGR
jgi:hypothetical protein